MLRYYSVPERINYGLPEIEFYARIGRTKAAVKTLNFACSVRLCLL